MQRCVFSSNAQSDPKYDTRLLERKSRSGLERAVAGFQADSGRKGIFLLALARRGAETEVSARRSGSAAWNFQAY